MSISLVLESGFVLPVVALFLVSQIGVPLFPVNLFGLSSSSSVLVPVCQHSFPGFSLV